MTAILCIVVVNACSAIWCLANHRYPVGMGPVLIASPALFRELDLRKGRKMRRWGSFEVSFVIAGVLFLIVFPFAVIR